MSKDYFFVRHSMLEDDFGIYPNKCKCRLNKNHTYSVNTTSILDERNNMHLITSLRVVCNTCNTSVYFFTTKKNVYEEELDYT